MSSARAIKFLGFGTIAALNIGLIGLAVKQHEKNKEDFDNLPAEEQERLRNENPVHGIGNSGDVYAALQEKAAMIHHRMFSHPPEKDTEQPDEDTPSNRLT